MDIKLRLRSEAAEENKNTDLLSLTNRKVERKGEKSNKKK